WFSLFPSIFFLGIAGPWIMFQTIPLWAFQHAIINALICMSWVMVHHIPDIKADQRAVPQKRTSVVWFVEKFGVKFAHFPALIYLSMAGVFALTLGIDRLLAIF